ncbi:MAG TPA: cytochrome C oxidase subunit IV family protein [Candidatus Saccharimonadales bacterium]|nr:cytochrome C oxidase subunit IV family protein [Candidatus Saccharimonadales bacterium]
MKAYVLAWLFLMTGFLLTLVLSRFNLGGFNIPAAITIAFAQMLVVIIYFMHARYSTRLTWLFAAAGFFWMGILFVLGLSDYLSRGWLH